VIDYHQAGDLTVQVRGQERIVVAEGHASIGLAVGTEHVCVRENSIATKHFAFIDRVQANGTNASMRYSGPACIGARAARTRWQVPNVLQHTMPIQDEHARLRKRIVGMRTTLLLFAKDPRAASGLRDLIAEAEARLAALEARRPLPTAPAL
jgi:hypothetical protein